MKRHPVDRITQIEFPVKNPFPATLSHLSWAMISADFLHAQRMGECYFYGAAGLVVKK